MSLRTGYQIFAYISYIASALALGFSIENNDLFLKSIGTVGFSFIAGVGVIAIIIHATVPVYEIPKGAAWVYLLIIIASILALIGILYWRELWVLFAASVVLIGFSFAMSLSEEEIPFPL